MAKEHLPHDAAYKQFFRNRDMVASLLRSFVPESFIADLDLATLEPYPQPMSRMTFENDITILSGGRAGKIQTSIFCC